MRSVVRTYLACFFLLLFLYPQAEKAIHELHHLEEAHCTDTSAHFCEYEHSCDLCECNISKDPGALTQPNCLFVDVSENGFTEGKESLAFDSEKYLFNLRGPPALA